MLLSLSQGSKSFGSTDVLKNVTITIKNQEKIALVGRNGSGKTTLLKILSNQESLDSGELFKRGNLSIGTLNQMSFEDDTLQLKDEFDKVLHEVKTIETQLSELANNLNDQESLNKFANLQTRFEHLGGYHYEVEMNSLMTSFGFNQDDLVKTLDTFSGGEKTRLAFMMMLLSKPDILLLDEPTNHLDITTIEWLEGYLQKYPAAIIVTSHDRLFLDRVCSVVVEVENQSLTTFKGNYSSYIEQKKNMMAKQEKLYNYQQKEIDRLEKLIDKFRYNKNKAAFAKSKQKYLDRMDRIDSPESQEKAMNVSFKSRIRGGNQVLNIAQGQIGYDDHVLLTVNLDLKRGQRLAVIGENGSGKSTLLKTIIQELPLISGEMMWGHQIEPGYFEQNLHQIEGTHTVLEELWDTYPHLTRTEVRTVLGSFLFRGDDVFKSVAVLSGGEKVRLQLAKLMLMGANLLILDEPTNHLDIESKQALESALKDYDGTILFVSHDRYFIQEVANGIAQIRDGKLKIELWDIKEALSQPTTSIKKQENNQEPPVNVTVEKRRLTRQIERLLEELEVKYEEIEALRDLRFEPEYYHDYHKMDELNAKIDDKNNEIENFESSWAQLEQELKKFDEKHGIM